MDTKQTALIIGKGIIGERHAKLIEANGVIPFFVSRRAEPSSDKEFSSIEEALRKIDPSFIWICTESSKHHDDLLTLDKIGYQKPMIVEKPLFSDLQGFSLSENTMKNVHVSYNFRLHPFIRYLKKELSNQEIISANIYVGQYLPDWRKSRDYQTTYSAKKELGGGSLRDLSHEIDFSLMLFGNIENLSSYGDFSHSLNISSDEIFQLHFKTHKKVSVLMEMNYLDRMGRRWILINTNEHTYFADFINGTLVKDTETIMSGEKIADTYPLQAKMVVEGNFEEFSHYHDGIKVLNFIRRAEESNWR